jgi:hypothetical protein
MLSNSNTINLRVNRFKSNTKFNSIRFENFDFKKGLKSINSKDLYFINMASNESEEVFDYIVNTYLNFLNGDLSFLDDFIADELLQDYKADRLLEILKKVQKVKYNRKDLCNIYKFRNLTDEALHFYIRKSRSNLSLILIDLYHMGIQGDKIVNGKAITIPMEKRYKMHRNNTIDLDRIKDINN